MNSLVTLVIVIVMVMMSVVPLLLVMYLGNERSRIGLIALIGALIGGAALGLVVVE